MGLRARPGGSASEARWVCERDTVGLRVTRGELFYKLYDPCRNMVRNLRNIIATSHFHTTPLYKYTGTRFVDSHLANDTQELNITRLHSNTLQ